MEKRFTAAQVVNFNEDDWTFERSSGYAGERNTNVTSLEYDRWIDSSEMHCRRVLRDEYREQMQTLLDFARSQGYAVDTVKMEKFLNDKYFL